MDEKAEITRIFVKNLLELKSLIEESVQTPNQKMSQNPEHFDEYMSDLLERIYIQLEKCWTIAEKGRQIQSLIREIYEIDNDSQNIN